MKGTEKQVKWAEDIRATVFADIQKAITRFTSDPQYDPSNQQHKDCVAMWETRCNLLNACDSAASMIEFFQAYRHSDNVEELVMRLTSLYRVTPNTGYKFK